MDDKCPKCGSTECFAHSDKPMSPTQRTYSTYNCYGRQLAAKNELLREALEVVRAWESYLLYTTDEVIRCDAPEKLPGGLDSARGKAFMKLRKARTLLPKLEAVDKEES